VGENIDLAPALGTQAMLRFRLESDSYLQRDGFSVDDLRVVLYGPAFLGVADDARPVRMSLEQNYPNPFNPGTTIRFSLVDPQFTILKVYDLLGREVAVLLHEKKEPGNYTVTWDAGGIAGGVYFYRLSAGASVFTRKMTYVK